MQINSTLILFDSAQTPSTRIIDKNQFYMDWSKILFLFLFSIWTMFDLLSESNHFYDKIKDDTIYKFIKDDFVDLSSLFMKVFIAIVLFTKNKFGILRFRYIKSIKIGLLIVVIDIVIRIQEVLDIAKAIEAVIFIIMAVIFCLKYGRTPYGIAFDDERLYLSKNSIENYRVYFRIKNGYLIKLEVSPDVDSKTIKITTDTELWYLYTSPYNSKKLSNVQKDTLFSVFIKQLSDPRGKLEIFNIQPEVKLNNRSNEELINSILSLKKKLEPFQSVFTKEHNEHQMKNGCNEPGPYFSSFGLREHFGITQVMQLNSYDPYGLISWDIKQNSLFEFMDDVVEKLQNDTLTFGEYIEFIEFLQGTVFSFRAYIKGVKLTMTQQRCIVSFNNSIKTISQMSTNIGQLIWTKKFENVEITG